ncbi:GtrA family protein [Paraprevotella xylaniphila]|uniref:GtrA family protein n=1 Tax=Paraprevotella xylaniphila TaxID=454155 RepID=UPI003FD7C832
MMQRKKLFVTFVRFGIVGVLATALHYGFYYLLHFVMGANAAFTVGYLLGFVFNFYMTSYFTFGTSPSWRKLFGMSGAYAFNYLLQIGLLNFFLCMGVDKVWAPFPVYAIAVPVNFILVRFVFTSKNE